MGLAAFKAPKYLRTVTGLRGFNLVKVIIIDQSIYFVLWEFDFSIFFVVVTQWILDWKRSAIVCAVLNIIDSTTHSDINNSVLSSIGSPAFLSLLGSRLFFNMKRAGERGVNVYSNFATYSFSNIVFAGSGHGEVSCTCHSFGTQHRLIDTWEGDGPVKVKLQVDNAC